MIRDEQKHGSGGFKKRFTPFPDSKTQFGLNQNPTQEEHLSSLIKDQPAVY